MGRVALPELHPRIQIRHNQQTNERRKARMTPVAPHLEIVVEDNVREQRLQLVRYEEASGALKIEPERLAYRFAV